MSRGRKGAGMPWRCSLNRMPGTRTTSARRGSSPLAAAGASLLLHHCTRYVWVQTMERVSRLRRAMLQQREPGPAPNELRQGGMQLHARQHMAGLPPRLHRSTARPSPAEGGAPRAGCRAGAARARSGCCTHSWRSARAQRRRRARHRPRRARAPCWRPCTSAWTTARPPTGAWGARCYSQPNGLMALQLCRSCSCVEARRQGQTPAWLPLAGRSDGLVLDTNRQAGLLNKAGALPLRPNGLSTAAGCSWTPSRSESSRSTIKIWSCLASGRLTTLVGLCCPWICWRRPSPPPRRRATHSSSARCLCARGRTVCMPRHVRASATWGRGLMGSTCSTRCSVILQVLT